MLLSEHAWVGGQIIFKQFKTELHEKRKIEFYMYDRTVLQPIDFPGNTLKRSNKTNIEVFIDIYIYY